MSSMTVGLIGMAIMLFLLFLGMPIAFAMALVGSAGILYFTSITGALNMVGTTPFDLIYNYNFCVLPLFYFMANICTNTRLSSDLFAMVYKWIGQLPSLVLSAPQR
jgi:C4-dicarboxylate transporter DctM subunit